MSFSLQSHGTGTVIAYQSATFIFSFTNLNFLLMRQSTRTKEDFLLIKQAQEGNERSFHKFYNKYEKSVFHTILKMVKSTEDAEDLTCEVFTKAWKNLSKFNPEYAPTTWLFRIASNHAIDFIRKRRLQTISIHSGVNNSDGESIYLDIECDNPDPEALAITKQRADLLFNIVAQLPQDDQELILSRYYNELSYKEIAEERTKPLGTIKAQLHRARKNLGVILEAHQAML